MMDGEPESNYYYNSTEDEDDDDIHVPLKKSAKDSESCWNFDEFETFRATQDFKLWDSFQDPPSEESSGSSIDVEWITSLTKLMKIFTYWLVFIIVAASGVLSKLSLLFMTSHIAENSKTPYCDIESESNQPNRKSMFLFYFPYQCPRSNLQRWFLSSKSSLGTGRLFLHFLYRSSELFCDRFDCGSSKASEASRWKSSDSFSCSRRCTSSDFAFSPSKSFPNSTSFRVPCWPTVCASSHRFCVRNAFARLIYVL